MDSIIDVLVEALDALIKGAETLRDKAVDERDDGEYWYQDGRVSGLMSAQILLLKERSNNKTLTA